MSNKKNPGLTRRASGLMALEQRFMFDGAAVADALDTAVDLQILAPAAMAPSESLAQAEARAEQLVTEFLKRPDAREQLFALFKGEQTGDQATPEWQAAVDQLLAQAEQGDLNVRVELRSAAELQGAKGAFSATGTTGEATIYLNADWVATADSESVAIVLTEELGHYLDHAINGDADTAGDEGEVFAQFVVNGTQPLPVSFDLTGNDHAILSLDGQQVLAELASFNFVNAYEMVYDLDNDTFGRAPGAFTSADIDTTERWASKEQNSHFFNASVSLGVVSISDGTGNQNFSGNDVSASTVLVGGNTYHGWISRPIKAGGVVRGFYFWTDTRFETLALAQADGNQDGDSNLNNRGFLFVVDQTWFNEQITANGEPYSGTPKPIINNTKDGNLGGITVANVGSSSDRVDSALNSVMVPNSAPVAANDQLRVNEDSGTTTVSASNGLLSNDSDANSDALSITGYTISGISGTQAIGNTVTIAGIGDLRINADGSYTFAPAPNYNGPVPPITYSVSDGQGGTSTAVLSITVDAVGDPPISTNDARTIDPLSTVLLSLSDFGSYSDPDGDPLAKIIITSLPSSGTLEYFDGSSWTAVSTNQELTAFTINAGQLRLTTATTDTAIGFKVSDGTLSSSAAYTLAITVPAAPAAPSASADTGTGAAYEAIEGVDGAAGTAAAGNVLTNDTGSDIKVTGVFNTSVAAVGNTSVEGKYGTLTISSTGAYSYAPNNTNAEVDALNVGDSLTETFSYTITDTNGNTATSTLTVKINGANDAPVARDDANSVKELAALTSGNYGTATGDVLTNDSDVDNSTGLEVVLGASDNIPSSGISTTASATSPINLAGTTYTVVDVSGSQWGSNNGIPTSYTTVLLNGQTIPVDGGGFLQVKRDGQGASLVIIFDKPETLLKYPLETVFGATGTTSLYKLTAISTQVNLTTTITLTSTPSQPILVGYVVSGTDIQANTTVTAVNGDTLTLSNAVQITNRSLTFTDPSAVTPTAGTGEMLKSGTYGYLRIAENGTYTYTLTSNVLNAGETYTETFTYQTTDGAAQSNTATLRIVIDGTSAAFTISAVNDSLTVDEDTPGTIANVLSNDPNTTTVTAYSWGNQFTTTAGNTLTLSGVGTLSITSGGLLTFTPATDYNGPVPSVTYTAKGAGTEEVSATVAINITSVNDAPTGTNDVITIEKNTDAILTLGDFGTFSDVDGDAFAGIKVTTLESAGTLSYNNGTAWVDVTLDQAISATDIAAGKLRYTPVTNAVGNNHATVGFQVFDGTTYSTNAYTLTVNVIDSVAASTGNPPVNTVPVAQTIWDYQSLTLTGLSVDDVDNDITSTTLTVANGTLTVTGAGATGAGTANSPLVITGNKATIDTLLATLVYTPSSAFAGTDVLRMHTSDANGNTDTDFVNITVNADARVLSVTGTTVNEASPYVYFKVAGVAGQKVGLKLSTTGVGDGHAIEGADHLPNLSYFNGTTWTPYTGGLVTVPTGNNLLVRTGVLQDTLNEGAETLKLIATNTAGTAYNGDSTIKDDGTGSIFLGNNTFAADTSGTGFPAYLDDDRPVTVNNIAVNEASPWAMFTVSGDANQALSLSLVNGTALVGDGNPADGTEDYSPTLQYWNGSAWTAYNGPSVTMTGSTLLVRTAVHQDTLFEGQHTFSLGVTKLSSGKAVYGSASIYDDGTGDIFAFDNDSDGTVTITSGPGDGFDDDRTLTINSPLVNEASDYAVFTLTGNSGQTVSLQLQDESNDGAVSGKANILENQTLKIWDGLTWGDYDATNLPTFDANGKIFVRVDIIAEQDTPFEGGETFKLNATLTGQTTAVTGVATIIDDGTGLKYPGTFTNGSPTTDNTNLDNDQTSLSVTGGRYNEGSPRAIFTVNASPGQSLTLDVLDEAENGKAPTGDDEGKDDDSLDRAPIYYSLNGGATWQLYNGTPITAGTLPVLVAIDISNESDNVYEGEEQFKLVVTSGNQSASAYGTIEDDGTGTVTKPISENTVNDTGSNDPAVVKDDDRAITVTGLDDVSEGSNAIFTVTLPDGNTRATEISLALSTGTAEADDYSRNFTAYYFVGNTKTALTINDGKVILPAGVSSFFVSVPTVQDTEFEGAENFSLTATITGGKNDADTSTILDDGTGKVYDDASTDSGAPGDDDRTITVDGLDDVSEGSNAIFTVTLPDGNTRATEISLALSNGSGANDAEANDYSSTFTAYYFVGDTKTDLTITGGKITLPSGVTSFFVSVPTTQDTDFEGAELFSLTATITGGKNGSDTSTILDDGSGRIYDDKGFNSAGPGNDDRDLAVTGGSYNEASPRAVFTVSAEVGQVLTLDVQDAASTGRAPTGDNEGKPNDSLDTAPIYYSLNGGASWQLYTGAITSGNVPVLVAVDITNERDDVYEGEEQLKLVVSSGGQSASGYSSILDDGTGIVTQTITAATTNVTGTNDPTVIKDNDKPQAVNDTLAVELGSTVTANIITRNDTPAASSQLQVRSIAFVDAFGVERSFNLNALQNSTRTDYDKQVQLADGKLYISANGDTLYQHEGRRFLVTAIENRGVLEHNATGLADGWTTVALNNSVVVSLQDIADGRLRFTATQALTDPEATVAQIVEMDWRSDGFTYTMSDSGGLTPSSANVIYTVTGDETIYLAPVAPGADADVDGIASRVESVLANKARGIEGIQPKTYVLDMNNLVASNAPGQSSIGIGVAFDGDLNIDSPTVGDAYQNSVTTFSWINNTYFAASNLNPDLGNFQSIVTLVAENQSTTSGVPHPDVQLRGVTVLPLSAEQESGLRALVKFTPNWSPMGFSAEIRSDATGVNNIDTDPNREGNQWRFTVDISRTGETTETFMGFVKWIDQATINAYAVAGLPLTTLDGQPITREGWVDFTQRVPGGDGVTITNADGNILLLQYTITDNAFGDNDLRTGYINDPGMPVFLQREILVADSAEVDEGGVASFAVSLNAIRLLPTTIDLSLQDVSTDSANGVPLDYAAQMEAYYIDATGNRQTLEVVNGRVQLPGGVASFNVLVRSTQDAEFETNETFTLTASLAEGATDSGSATIVDNDAPAELPVNPPAPPVLPQAPPAPPPPAPVEPPPPAPEPPPVATPEVPPPVIESPAPVLPPPTTPPAPAAPVAPPAPAPANTPAPVVPTPPPVPVAPQSFSSTLAPLAPALVPADAPAPLGEAVTSSSGVPIPVSETAPPGLSIYQGITNQFIQSTDTTSKISLPFDAFIHSNKDAVIQLEAKQADDSPLPNWVRFDPATGVFEVTPPKDFKGKLDLKVLARDDDGREAVAIFQMFIGEQTTDRPQSRDSFTDKLRMVGNRPITLVRVVDASRPVAAPAPVREAPAIKAVPA